MTEDSIFARVSLKDFNKRTKQFVRAVEASPTQIVTVMSGGKPVAMVMSPPLFMKLLEENVQVEDGGVERAEESEA